MDDPPFYVVKNDTKSRQVIVFAYDKTLLDMKFMNSPLNLWAL